MLSASPASSATSGVVSSGSGSHWPTYASLRRFTVHSRLSLPGRDPDQVRPLVDRAPSQVT
jgi:hypothetical protein